MLTKQRPLCNLIFILASAIIDGILSNDLDLYQSRTDLELRLVARSSFHNVISVSCSSIVSDNHVCNVPIPAPATNSVTTFFCLWKATSPMVTRHRDYHKSLWSSAPI